MLNLFKLINRGAQLKEIGLDYTQELDAAVEYIKREDVYPSDIFDGKDKVRAVELQFVTEAFVKANK